MPHSDFLDWLSSATLKITISGVSSKILMLIKHYVCVCPSVTFCLSPGDKQFVCPTGDKHFLHTVGGGQTNCLSPGDKHFLHTGGAGGTNKLFVPWGQTFSVEDGGDNYDVYGEDERDVSEANIFASKASKLSAGARILRGP